MYKSKQYQLRKNVNYAFYSIDTSYLKKTIPTWGNSWAPGRCPCPRHTPGSRRRSRRSPGWSRRRCTGASARCRCRSGQRWAQRRRRRGGWCRRRNRTVNTENYAHAFPHFSRSFSANKNRLCLENCVKDGRFCHHFNTWSEIKRKAGWMDPTLKRIHRAKRHKEKTTWLWRGSHSKKNFMKPKLVSSLPPPTNTYPNTGQSSRTSRPRRR